MTASLPLDESAAVLIRSAESLAFEAMWRGLRKDGQLLPTRTDFHPGKAKRFLPDIVLSEVSMTEPCSRVRLAGSGLDARLHKSIAGSDFIECLPPRFRDGAVRSMRLMVSHPCGLWQISRIHYERGMSYLNEITIFPLAPADDGIPMLLSLIQQVKATPRASQPHGKAMLVDTAETFEFLDLGAGTPAWGG